MYLKTGKLLSLFVVLMFVLAACGGNNNSAANENNGGNNDTGNNESSNTQEEETIVFSTGKDTTGEVQKVVDAFEDEHPNINVEVQEQPNDSGKQHDTYVTSLSSQSTEPDVFEMDVVWPAEFAQGDYIAPLDRFIEQDDIDLDKYNQGALSASQFKGKQWALPRRMGIGLLYYRKDIVDHPPQTWDELTEMARNNKGKEGTKFGYTFQGKQYEGLVTNAIELINAYGGSLLEDENVLVNSEDTIEALKKLKELSKDDIAPENITTFEEPDTEQAFIEGNSVFARQWPNLWSSAKDEEKSEIVDDVGVAPLPEGDEGSYGALGGWQMAINKYSEHKEAAWELLKYMTGEEGQKIMSIEGSRLPTIKSLYEDEDVLDANPFFNEQGFQDALSGAVSRPVAPDYQKVSDIIQIHVSNVLSDKESAEEAAEGMEKELEEVMNE